MVTEFQKLISEIKKIPGIKHVDIERGQIEKPKENDSILFPAVLLKFNYMEFEELGIATEKIEISFGFDIYFDGKKKQTLLEDFDLINKIRDLLKTKAVFSTKLELKNFGDHLIAYNLDCSASLKLSSQNSQKRKVNLNVIT
jgi:hypothetical protein